MSAFFVTENKINTCMTASTGKPIWITPKGDLGTIQENKFYQLTLEAENSNAGEGIDTLYYTMIAGELPEGIQCTKTGIIEGNPKGLASVQGVPQEVGANTEYKFTVRSYTEKEDESINRVADRTFRITIAGRDDPEWVTKPSDIKNAYDGDQISYQLEFTDPDPDETHTFTVIDGELPPGVTLGENTGLLAGTIQPVADLPENAVAGYDIKGSAYDQYAFDHTSQSSSRNYEFTIELSDGRASAIQTFSIYVYSKDNLTADTGEITVDNTDITADVDTTRTPYITTPAGSLGTFRHDNYFAYQFQAVDTDGDAVEFALTTGDAAAFDADTGKFDETGIGFDRAELKMVPGLTLDVDTGYLYGYIPDQGLTDVTYTIGLQVKKRDNSAIKSEINFYTVRVIGAVDTDITWTNPTNVATINNGDKSIITMEAVASSGVPLAYRLKSGSKSRLPQGLTLQQSGNITGTASFQTFMLDAGTTTFAEDLGTRRVIDPTIFDTVYKFEVEAYNTQNKISVFKEFTLTVNLKYKTPYETVYMKATPDQTDRADIIELLENKDIFKDDLIYRADDPNFGVTDHVRYNHAFGIKPDELKDYVDAMSLNHYRKDLVLGEIKVAQALDLQGNVVYEAVYSEVQQKLKNNNVSVSLAVQRTPFLEDNVKDSVIDASRTASSTETSADDISITADAGVPEDSSDPFVTTSVKADSTKIFATDETFTTDATFYNEYRFDNINDTTAINTVYPNSLDNMRQRIIDKAGQFSDVLPLWMQTKQDDGRILGFQSAWVIAYAKPGKGNELKYNIDNLHKKKVNTIDFEMDRYTVERIATQNYDVPTQKWTTGRQTTFNKFIKSQELKLVEVVDLATDTLAFSQIHGATITTLTGLGGIDTKKTKGDINGKTMIFVKQEDFTGLTEDQAFTRDGVVISGPLQARGDSSLTNDRLAIYTISVDSSDVISLTLKTKTDTNDYVEILDGSKFRAASVFIPRAPAPGLRFVTWQTISFEVNTGQTIFDGNAMRFISKRDKTINDDRLDKYVLYPKHTITGNQDYIKL